MAPVCSLCPLITFSNWKLFLLGIGDLDSKRTITLSGQSVGQPHYFGETRPEWSSVVARRSTDASVLVFAKLLDRETDLKHQQPVSLDLEFKSGQSAKESASATVPPQETVD